MSSEIRKFLIVIGIFCVAGLLVLRISYKGNQSSGGLDIDTIPMTIGGWQAKTIPVTDRVFEVLGTEEVLTRIYTDSQGNQVVLLVVYSENNRDSFHPPEICYIGGGSKMTDQRTEEIPLSPGEVLTANNVLMRQGGRATGVWYWFMVNDRIVTNYYWQQAYLFLEALKGRPMKGAMVRISVSGDSESSQSRAKSFIAEIVPVLKKIFKT